MDSLFDKTIELASLAQKSPGRSRRPSKDDIASGDIAVSYMAIYRRTEAGKARPLLCGEPPLRLPQSLAAASEASYKNMMCGERHTWP